MIEWTQADDFHKKAKELIKPAAAVLDIGCGIHPQQYIVPDLLICIEPYIEYVNILKQNLEGTNSIIISMEAKESLLAFPDRSVDAIFLIDVIEHMSKQVGAEVIKECLRVARGQIIIFTPLGFMPQKNHAKDGWNLGGGDWQEHKSGWYPEDFLGWQIVACKHLHTHDVQGQKIDPPYGGFYAIKNIEKSANYFNDIYLAEILSKNTKQFSDIQNFFPDLSEKIITREIAKSNLVAALKLCQYTTSTFIDFGDKKSASELNDLVKIEKDRLYASEVNSLMLRINNFAEEFTKLDYKEENIQLTINHVKEIENLKNHIIYLELQLSRINKNIFIRIYKKISRMFN